MTNKQNWNKPYHWQSHQVWGFFTFFGDLAYCAARALSQARIPSARSAQKLLASAHLGAWRRRAAYGHLWGLHYTVFHVKKDLLCVFYFVSLHCQWKSKVTKNKVKGQFISKANFEVFSWTKKGMKRYLYFCTSL